MTIFPASTDMNKGDHINFGKLGETMAQEYLIKNGFEILEVNWRYRYKEIDILAQYKDHLVVVEVKSRSTEYFGNPSDAVTQKKQNLLFEAAEAFLEENELDMETRFDIITIVLNHETCEIKHIENAFSPQPE